ncbi:hypothetical protein ckin28_03880 [Helicobacter pylori]
MIVWIALEKGKDDPQLIFESMNSKGIELTQTDLIRNYIVMETKTEEKQKTFIIDIGGLWRRISHKMKHCLIGLYGIISQSKQERFPMRKEFMKLSRITSKKKG